MLQHLAQDLCMRLRLLLSLPAKTKNQGLSQVAKGMEDSTITQIKCTKLLIEAGVKFEWLTNLKLTIKTLEWRQ